MKLTRNKLDWFAQLHELIVEIAEKYGEIKHGYKGLISIHDANSNGFTIDVSWTEGCCGHYDTMQGDFFLPNEILLNPNWEAELKAQIAEEERLKKEQEKARKAQEKLEQKQQREANERAEYERLKAKYE